MTMFAFVALTIVQEHGGRFLSCGMLLRHMCLRFVCVVLEALLAWHGMAWHSSSIAFLLVPLPPSAFLV